MRAILLVTIAVFALTSVVYGATPKAKIDATADAQVHLYGFVSRDCTGQPFTSPYEMKQGECVNFNQARSLRPRFRSDHAEWVKEVNELRMHCKLETFSDFGCPENNKTEEYRSGLSGDLPENFNSCLISERQKSQQDGSHDGDSSGDEQSYSNDFYSAKFVCGKLEDPEHLCTSTIEHTSWSIDPTYGAPHPQVHTAVYTGSLSATAHVAARTAAVERFKPSGETKSVWMQHPWGYSLLCYLCYPEKEHDYREIECRAGTPYPANCGAVPIVGMDGRLPTPSSSTTSTTTAVTTTHRTKTTTTIKASRETTTISRETGALFPDSSSDEDLPRLDIELQQKKSWHTPVKFVHPFLPGKDACADAEWEKRGQTGKDFIKIQKVHICDDKDRDDSQWIGLPETAVHTEHRTKTSTDTIMHTSTSTSTSTIRRTSIIRHDQL